jgi:hypothetical protein
MKLYIVLAQRKEAYPGQFAPEALAVVTEYDRDENPDWIQSQLDDAKKDPDMLAADIFEIDLGNQATERIRSLLIDFPKMDGFIRPV